MSWYESMFHIRRTLNDNEIRWLQDCGYGINISPEIIDVTIMASNHRVFAGQPVIEIKCHSLEQETVLRLKFGDDLIRSRVQVWNGGYVPKT